eukprot:393877-Prymnesium_polylepis.1
MWQQACDLSLWAACRIVWPWRLRPPGGARCAGVWCLWPPLCGGLRLTIASLHVDATRVTVVLFDHVITPPASVIIHPFAPRAESTLRRGAGGAEWR